MLPCMWSFDCSLMQPLHAKLHGLHVLTCARHDDVPMLEWHWSTESGGTLGSPTDNTVSASWPITPCIYPTCSIKVQWQHGSDDTHFLLQQQTATGTSPSCYPRQTLMLHGTANRQPSLYRWCTVVTKVSVTFKYDEPVVQLCSPGGAITYDVCIQTRWNAYSYCSVKIYFNYS